MLLKHGIEQMEYFILEKVYFKELVLAIIMMKKYILMHLFVLLYIEMIFLHTHLLRLLNFHNIHDGIGSWLYGCGISIYG